LTIYQKKAQVAKVFTSEEGNVEDKENAGIVLRLKATYIP
jgi:hypothetical protein